MLAMLLAVQTQVAGRPSGLAYVLTMSVTAVLGGALVAFVASRIERPERAAEPKADPLDVSRPGVTDVPTAVTPQGIHIR